MEDGVHRRAGGGEMDVDNGFGFGGEEGKGDLEEEGRLREERTGSEILGFDRRKEGEETESEGSWKARSMSLVSSLKEGDRSIL